MSELRINTLLICLKVEVLEAIVKIILVRSQAPVVLIPWALGNISISERQLYISCVKNKTILKNLYFVLTGRYNLPLKVTAQSTVKGQIS